MTWDTYYRGTGEPHDTKLPDPPPWRAFPRRSSPHTFQPPEGLTDAVNAAVFLHRPLLITGAAGSGKSTVIEQVADELRLGSVLRWHITSRSTLPDALYRYDALGHIHTLRLAQSGSRGGRKREEISEFLQLGPLGTALLPDSPRPRALLIDEIDKSDLDLPSDLLDVLERGVFEIPELVRHSEARVPVRRWRGDDEDEATEQKPYVVHRGRVQCRRFPFIVMTSNGEREFPAPFLRRCIRYDMPPLSVDLLHAVVEAHVERKLSPEASGLVKQFVDRVARGETLAVDQLLNAVKLLIDHQGPTGEQRDRLITYLLRNLTGA
ncbi:ATPase AAA [Streptomyces virginiae]|uniref:ATPase AAA n=1 Tax=Streptomyces virginiae TaxID=1961 RepID=A0ABQ3NRE6_STRVG|nr:ATPase [Streptomyces virginiae]MBP2348115.1 MoxR-like ATPase [Streptomyces virginiae]GGQ05761.1 ATPase AAA [Streptomyces virginiae]GHI15326.1 ATPase AAA [Streptomyces virginiae]